jgi:hypothetical protein
MRYTLIPSIFSIILIFLCLPQSVHAESIFDRYLSGGHFRMELTDDAITDTSKFETEIELRFRYDELNAFVRAGNDRPFAYQTDGFEVRKRGFNYELNDDWEVTGGDYSLVFARGLALNATENVDVDHDSQLDGLVVEGDLGFADLTAFWGRHRSDGPEYYVSGVNTTPGDPSDELMGARLDFDLDDFDLGFNYINADITRFGEPTSTVVTEIDAQWRVDNVTLFYDHAWFNNDRPGEEEESLDGTGQLAEILYAEGGYSISGSWVRYDHAHFDYGTAPSLRRAEIDDSEANADDETGWRADFRISPPEWSGSSLRLLYTDLNGIRNKDQEFKNYFIEWSSSPMDEYSWSLSYDRIDGFLQFYGAVNGTDSSVRGTLDGPFPFGGSFHLAGRYRHLSNDFDSDDEVEMGLDWHANPDFTVGILREISTRNVEPPPPGLTGISSESPGQWDSAFLRWNPDMWNQFDLTVGSQRGGFHCSGGTCAQLPPFKGISFVWYRSL